MCHDLFNHFLLIEHWGCIWYFAVINYSAVTMFMHMPFLPCCFNYYFKSCLPRRWITVPKAWTDLWLFLFINKLLFYSIVPMYQHQHMIESILVTFIYTGIVSLKKILLPSSLLRMVTGFQLLALWLLRWWIYFLHVYWLDTFFSFVHSLFTFTYWIFS